MACEEVYEVLRVLVSEQVNPVLYPPPMLNATLFEVQKQLIRYANLQLPKDPELSLWEIYPILRITPVIVDNLVVLMLKVPLVDRKVNLTLHRIHNLPALHPATKIGYKFVLEGDYYMTTQDGRYEVVPTTEQALACIQSKGHVCTLTSALYRIEDSRLCMSAIYHHNATRIDQYCQVDPHVRSDNLATNLGHHVWAISSLVNDDLHITCPLKPNRIQPITPPLTFVEIADGCEAFSNSLYIPSAYQFNTESHELRARMFIEFNDVYQQPLLYSQWFKIKIPSLTPEELAQLQYEVEQLPRLPMQMFQKKLTLIDEDYVSWMPSTRTIGIGLIILTVIIVIVIVGMIYWKCRSMKTARSIVSKVVYSKKKPASQTAESQAQSTPSESVPEPEPTPSTSNASDSDEIVAINYDELDNMARDPPLPPRAITHPSSVRPTEVEQFFLQAMKSLADDHQLDPRKYAKYLTRKASRSHAAAVV